MMNLFLVVSERIPSLSHAHPWHTYYLLYKLLVVLLSYCLDVLYLYVYHAIHLTSPQKIPS